MKKISVSLILWLLVSCSALFALNESPVSSGQPDRWVTRDSQHFVFIYRERDRSFADDLIQVADVSYAVVCGYFGFEPQEKPKVILYGDQDTPSFGGYCGPFPLRIALSAATSYSARTLLTHEFTHWMNAVRPTGFMYVLSNVFGRDLSFISLGLEFHFVEGITSFLDGERSDTWNEMQYKAPLLEERMWTFEQTWTGGDSQPGPLRTYLSGMLLSDYLYRHFGSDAFARLEKRFAAFPFLGDTEALRFVTGMDPRLVWSEALREARQRFSADGALKGGTIMTPQESETQYSWVMIQDSAHGLLVSRSSLKDLPQFGFWRPAQPGSAGSANWQPITGLLDNVVGATINRAGDLMVVSRAADALSGRDDERAVADLWAIKLEPSSDGKSFKAETHRLTHNAQLTRPALSPDGSRLMAVQRISNEWRLVEVDLTSGAIRTVIDATKASGTQGTAFSVVRVSFADDGKSLGLLLAQQGQTDLATCASDGSNLNWITHDSATEMAPHFAPDGRLFFASDRENAIVLYAWDPISKQISRILRDPVAVWNGLPYTSGNAPEMFIYQGYTSQGYVLKSLPVSDMQNTVMPDFANLSPDWIARRDALWHELAGRAPPTITLSTQTQLDSGPPSEKPLVDIALPVLWLPSVSSTTGMLGVGAQIQAASLLASNQWTLGLAWIPLASQLTLEFIEGIYQPGFTLSAEADLNYQVLGSSAAPVYRQDRDISVDLEFDLFTNRYPDGSTVRLQANMGSLASWQIGRQSSFDFVSSLSMPAVFKWQLNAGLGVSLAGAASSKAVFGAGAIDMSGQFYARPLLDGWGLAGKLSTALQAPIGLTALRLEVASALDATEQAAALVPPLSSAWTVADGFSRTEAWLYWCIPLGFDPTPTGQFSIEKRGLILGAGGAGAVQRDGSVSLDKYLVMKVEYRFWLLWTITPVPVVAGVALRTNPADANDKGGLVVVYFGIYGQSVSFGAGENPLP